MAKSVKVSVEAFRTAAKEMGYPSDYRLAKDMEIARSTLQRVLTGELQPGPGFIAGALTALPHKGFDDLFVIVSVYRSPICRPQPAREGRRADESDAPSVSTDS